MCAYRKLTAAVALVSDTSYYYWIRETSKDAAARDDVIWLICVRYSLFVSKPRCVWKLYAANVNFDNRRSRTAYIYIYVHITRDVREIRLSKYFYSFSLRISSPRFAVRTIPRGQKYARLHPIFEYSTSVEKCIIFRHIIVIGLDSVCYIIMGIYYWKTFITIIIVRVETSHTLSLRYFNLCAYGYAL